VAAIKAVACALHTAGSYDLVAASALFDNALEAFFRRPGFRYFLNTAGAARWRWSFTE